VKKDLVKKQADYIQWLERKICETALVDGNIITAKTAIDEVLRIRKEILGGELI